ncbi:MAG: hypothetical protein DHS20C11_28270 [Lysobacteraceae bacterium]|nr:MAG: hypothetical protein DHS20C11_28270 [Xanthomonadaceae bacterium]
MDQAFASKLRAEISAVQKRCLRLCTKGWDLNTVSIVYQQVQELVAESADHGAIDASDLLFSLEVYLSSFIESAIIPSPAQLQEIERLVNALSRFSDQASASLSPPIIASTAPPPPSPKPAAPKSPAAKQSRPQATSQAARKANKSTFGQQATASVKLAPIPTSIAPPVGFLPPLPDAQGGTEPDNSTASPAVHDTGNGAVAAAAEIEAPADSVSMAEVTDASVAAPEPSAEAATPTETRGFAEASPARPEIYLLATLEEVPLERGLAQHFDVERIDDPTMLSELLAAVAPDAMVISASFAETVERFGEQVKRTRKRQNKRLPLVVLADNLSLERRLAAMRAGADVVMDSNVAPSDVNERLSELLETATDDPYRVLIVEDDRSQAMFAGSILRKAGMEARTVEDSMQVIEALKDFQPDMILMDLYMPECDGMELTTVIREQDDFISTPIVFLSGEQDEEKHFEAISAGGDDFLSKPIRPKHLISAVTNRVRRSRALAKRRPAAVVDENGMLPREAMIERLNALAATGDAVGGGVLFIEIDQPFRLREKLGLSGYEQLLTQLGGMMASRIEGADAICRYSDTAYVVILTDREHEQLDVIARMFYQVTRDTIFDVEDTETVLTTSIGITELVEKPASGLELLSRAERACRLAYSSTSERVRFYRPVEETIEAVEGVDEVIEGLKRAIVHGGDELALLFQPIVSLRGETDEQYQTVISMVTETLGRIDAPQLWQKAIAGDLGLRLDQWILEQATSNYVDRVGDGRAVRFFVTQSGTNLGDDALLSTIEAFTKVAPPHSLALEIPLAAVSEKLRSSGEFFAKLNDMGVHVCLSSSDGSDEAMQVIERLPVSYLKVDIASGAIPAGELRERLGGLVKRCHELERRVIVSSIEDAKSAAQLWTSGVDFIQGDFVQQPDQHLRFDFLESAF